MKRRKASAKMTNVVHSGWMTKSPPERKLNSAFKIFRSQWKKRYFVLRKPSGSLPDQYELHYYKDQKCSAKKGSIDLEQCEQIIEALDSDVFPYLLAIKTYYKNKVRTYYLAADTEQEMNSWVQWLCHVCGLKPEDHPTDIPDPKPSQASGVVRQTSIIGAGPVVANGRPPSPQRPASPGAAAASVSSPLSASPQAAGGFQSASTQVVVRTLSDSSLCYIPLENCTTGQPPAIDRRESVESVPDFEAPAPPQKLHGSHINGTPNLEDDVFTPNLYDHPPVPRLSESSSHSRGSSDLYKIPPVRPTRGKTLGAEEDGRDSSYDVPPPRGHSPRSSSLSTHTDSWVSSGGSDRSVTPTECYDYPPPRRDPVVSSDGETPPARPPKPGHLQSPYQNLPPAGNISTDTNLMSTVPAPPKHSVRYTSGYDVPRSSSHHLSRALQSGHSHVATVPPRPSRYTPTTPSTHTYLNTQNKAGSSELHPASGGASGSESNTDLADLGVVLPVVPPPRTDSAGEPVDAGYASSSLYQSPPSSSALPASSGAPVRPPVRTNPQPASVSPRSHDGNSVNNQDENAAVIFSTQRTRSFKRNQNVNNVSPKPSPKLNLTAMSAPVPAPRPVPPSRPKEISSDEDEEARHHEQEEQTHHPLSLLRAVPPPSADNDRELKYIDLALPESSQEPPRSSHVHGHGHTHSHAHNHMDRSKESATEYREIDFVKTQALNDTKRVKEKERKNDDHN